MRFLLVAVLALSLAAAGVSSASGTTLTLKADKAALRYDRTLLSAKAGTVTIVMANPSPLPHNVAVNFKGPGTGTRAFAREPAAPPAGRGR